MFSRDNLSRDEFEDRLSTYEFKLSTMWKEKRYLEKRIVDLEQDNEVLNNRLDRLQEENHQMRRILSELKTLAQNMLALRNASQEGEEE